MGTTSRATEIEVKAIMDTALTEEQITPFLRSATLDIDRLPTDHGYSEGRLREIEAWLAAHNASARDPQITEEKTGQTTTKYGGTLGTGLDSTRFGQVVKRLDYKGYLSQGDTIGATIQAVGPYDD